jgi:hypothetical protein
MPLWVAHWVKKKIVKIESVTSIPGKNRTGKRKKRKKEKLFTTAIKSNCFCDKKNNRSWFVLQLLFYYGILLYIFNIYSMQLKGSFFFPLLKIKNKQMHKHTSFTANQLVYKSFEYCNVLKSSHLFFFHRKRMLFQ